MSEKLPQGWIRTSLGKVAQPSRERALPTDVPDMPYVGLENIEPHTMKLLGHGYASEVRSSCLRFSKGGVLYGKMRPYLNKVWVAEFDGLCSAEFIVFSKREEITSEFLAARLNSEDFVAFANGQVSGERPRVDFDKLARFTILLPPAAEQERITAKLDAALSALRRAEAASVRARARLQRYRSAVLRASVIGELTREWREKQPITKQQTAETVLNRFVLARRKRHEEGQLGLFQEKEQALRSDRQKSRPTELAHPDLEDMPTIPESWAWASMEMIADIGTGISVSQNRRVENPVSLPYLRVANVLRGYLDLSDVRTIRVEKDRVTAYLLEVGDILFTEGGDRDKLGRGWIWEGQIDKCVHQNHIFRARPFDLSLVSPKLISHWGNTFGQQFFLKHGKQTTNLASINRGVLSRLPVPMASPEEQTEILREIDHRLASADKLSAALDKQLDRARVTHQSILSDAFSGTLIPQNPDDEPADALIERIRATRAASEAERKPPRQESQPTRKRGSDSMRESSPTSESLKLAWERIGRKANARRLFDEAGFDADHVVQFYETLRSIPELRTAFEEAARGTGQKRKSAPQAQETEKSSAGRFRLIDLWLEDFKNLKDYAVRFNPAEGLDVVLGWNGTGKSNLFEALVIIFRDLHGWWEKNRWPEKPMNGFRLAYELDEHTVEVTWRPTQMKRPEIKRGPISRKANTPSKLEPVKREELPLPRFVFGYYSGPTNRLAEHFLPMKQDHYDRLRLAKADDAKTLAQLLEQRRFFCAETHHAKYVLLGFSYKEDPKINEFLENRLRIVGFESALFIIRRPPWAKQGSKPEEFWSATGIMRRVMERLRRYAIAPMIVKQKVSYGYRSTTEDHYYFFLPDLDSLHAFAAEYQDARTFFLALESTDFSELIHDVKIQVRVKSTNAEQVSITFHQLSEGEQQLLMVLGLMRFTKSNQSLVLLDEPDTHLNPHWSVDYVKDLARVMSDNANESKEQQTSQILMATHDPLVIASLIKEQIHLLKRDARTGACKWEPASVNPRGLGFTGILTSEMFGFRSDLDPETLADLDNRVRLIAKEEGLTPQEKTELESIDKRLAAAGFSKAFSDPYYAAFVRAWGRRHSELMAGEQFLTAEKRQEIDRIAGEVLKEAVAEVEKGVGN
jgi:restriction endonuclease S subunit/predicted ATPase